jgi:hypothetical protein
MPMDIRPFTEVTGDSTSPVSDPDSRATTFMDTLRTRITQQDETQQQKWEKAVKPAAARKPLTPARPGWLKAPKPPQAPQKPAAVPRTRPFGSPKRSHR